MKKRILFGTLGLALGLGLGVGAGLTAPKEVKEVEAAPAGYSDVYLDLGSCNWASKENATMYAYYYGSATASTTWTGNPMTYHGYGLYTAVVPSNTSKIVFNVNGWSGDCQTDDLTFNASQPLWTITTSYTNGTKQSASSQAYSEKTVYVLDKTGTLLKTAHKAHIWRNSGSPRRDTSWPGVDMTLVSGRIYAVTFPSFSDMIIFHDNAGHQTANLSIDGECSVLEDDWNGTTWVSLAAAQFVDGYMHFYDVKTTSTGSTSNCAAYYTAAKNAYNALASDAVRKEVLGVEDVKDRLGKWAIANGTTLDANGGVLAAGNLLPSLTNNDSTNRALMVGVISAIAVAALGGWFALRKKKSVN